MGKTTLTWEYDGLVGEGFKIYRDDSPMDPENLPTPIATVGIEVREYVDETVIDNETYYYRVASYLGDTERISEEIEHTAAYAGDPHWDKVVALLHFDGNLADETGRAWTLSGGAVISSDNPVYGTGSLLCEGLTHAAQTTNPIGSTTAHFTIETTFVLTSWPGPQNGNGNRNTALWGQPQNSSNGEFGIRLAEAGSVLLDLRGGTPNLIHISEPLEWEVGVRYHAAHTFDGTFHRVFINGQKVLEVEYNIGWKNTNQPFSLGMMYIPSFPQNRSGAFAKFDEFRITKGVARYIENFTPPTDPFPNY